MAKFDPFLSLDCARVEGVGAQSKERKGSHFAAQRSGAIVLQARRAKQIQSKNLAIDIWKPCLQGVQPGRVLPAAPGELRGQWQLPPGPDFGEGRPEKLQRQRSQIRLWEVERRVANLMIIWKVNTQKRFNNAPMLSLT